MSAVLAAPVLLPLLGAALSILSGRSRPAQRIIALTALTAVLVCAAVLLVEVDRNGPVVMQAGGWPAPLGITLIADRLSALMLTVAAAMLLAVLVFAIGEPGAERNHVGFQSVYLVLAAGVFTSFLTGDLFNLFVAFEMMLTSSYVLMTLGGRPEQVRTGMTYVVISLIASALFLMTLALIYVATATMNLADLSIRLSALPSGLQRAFAVLLLVVFGIKAALFPLFFWLPDAYPAAPSPVTAIFAGLLTKVGVYAIIRTQTLLIPAASRPANLILVVAALTMIIGVLGAIAQSDMKRILSFNIVSHIGFMAMGLGLFSAAGLAATVFYAVHHIVAKTAMFLTGGLVEHVGGSGRLSRLGGLVHRTPTVAVLFLIPALSLAGIPPLSGFVAKLGLVRAGVESDAWLIVAVAVVVSLLTLFSMMKIWSGVFWGAPDDEGVRLPVRRGLTRNGPLLMVAPTVVLVALGVGIAVAGGPLWSFSERAAADLLDPSGYVSRVLVP